MGANWHTAAALVCVAYAVTAITSTNHGLSLLGVSAAPEEKKGAMQKSDGKTYQHVWPVIMQTHLSTFGKQFYTYNSLEVISSSTGLR